ncbi:MAG: hypothetical protein HQL11_02870, partial [Candidatus Omnitrophica bacterium]|nr:hypothetical protein [Candidatus Omnitrophota bacterium]
MHKSTARSKASGRPFYLIRAACLAALAVMVWEAQVLAEDRGLEPSRILERFGPSVVMIADSDPQKKAAVLGSG